jgi:hypothetical protein
LQALEVHLQEAKLHVYTLQAQLKALTLVERMKRFPEQCTAKQQVHTLQSKVMEVSQRLQPVQEKECQLFTEVESQGATLEHIIITA